MKAVVFRGIGKIRLDDVPEPKIEQPTDAIVRLTVSAVCRYPREAKRYYLFAILASAWAINIRPGL